MSVTPFVQAMLDPVLTNPFHQLSTWFKNEDPTTFETTHGRVLWDYTARDPKFNNLFNESMASDARFVTNLLLEKGREVFDKLESLVDVGGGTGTMAKALANSFPELECIVFDLPHVVDGLQGSDNLNYVGGNMFQEIPPADAILLKKKGKEGKVIIIDMVLDNEKKNINESVETQLLFDMFMMVLLTGKERNKREWIKLITSAGFSDFKITPILGLRSVIEIYP
ncbi:hypothetical protein RYX36_006595 [Vicia faba]